MGTWQQDREYTDQELERLLYVLGVREENHQLSSSVESTGFGELAVYGDLTSLALGLARARGIDVAVIRDEAARYARGDA